MMVLLYFNYKVAEEEEATVFKSMARLSSGIIGSLALPLSSPESLGAGIDPTFSKLYSHFIFAGPRQKITKNRVFEFFLINCVHFFTQRLNYSSFSFQKLKRLLISC